MVQYLYELNSSIFMYNIYKQWFNIYKQWLNIYVQWFNIYVQWFNIYVQIILIDSGKTLFQRLNF